METQEREREQDSVGGKLTGIDLDALLTPADFGRWIGESESWVRRRLGSIPGVIRESRKHIRIHPRTYLEKRLNMGPISRSKRSW